MTLGDYIKEYRLSHNYSMDEFARRSGLSKAYVSILERDFNPSTKRAAIPSLETIKRVSIATGTDLNDLLAILDSNQEESLNPQKDPLFSLPRVMEMQTHENIKLLRERQGLSQEELALKVGYKDRSSIAKVEAGLVDLTQSKIAAFAAAFNVTPAQLIGIPESSPKFPENILPLPRMKKWKVLGGTACAAPLYKKLDNETVLAPADIDADYVFRCVGDSMINARIFDGDIVFVKSGVTVEDGQIAVVRIGEEYTLKRIYHGPDYLELRSENPLPEYKPIFVRGEQENAEIVGLAVKFLSNVI